MKKFPQLLSTFLFLNIVNLPSNADEVIFRSSQGILHVIEVTPENSFIEVLHLMQGQNAIEESKTSLEYLNQEYIVDFMAALDKSSNKSTVKASQKLVRDYYAGLTSSDKKDLAFIVTTLGNSSLVSIAKQKSALKKAGERIDHIHPFWFVLGIMLDEKNKAALHNIINRSWVYSEFFKGLYKGLSEESAKNNIKPEHIQDFASKLNIDPDAITPALNEKRWQDFFDIVIKLVPRSGNPDRYDM